MGSVQFMFLRGVLFKAAAAEPPFSALGLFVPERATMRQYSAAVSRSTDDQEFKNATTASGAMQTSQCIESPDRSELCAVSVCGLGSASIVFRLKSVAYFGDGGRKPPH